ncbi:hypothetical protein CA13_34950 [Planctomycetes bacterium CA13]|uniref:Uncharacterized protein n=1 Tax=Novipirellula herctigrandis TaxID=2527986 RepID=A0A5C5Z4C7_9BACT|nr:hypothetical protein CA13_34950 [Planctomycetes bacterium CA13]
MKMNLRGLALSALLLSASNMSYAQQGATSTVGDLPGYDEDAYFADEATFQEQVSAVSKVSHSDSSDSSQAYAQSYVGESVAATGASPSYTPVAASQLQPVGFLDGQLLRGRSSSSCDGACDGGCDSCGGGSSLLGLGKMFSCGSDTWAVSEFLMWFAPDRDMPALVTMGPAGVIPFESVSQTVFGDDINGDMSVGFRGDYGKYVSKNIGIGGRFWMMTENEDSYYASGNGTGPSIGRPFFNTDIPSEDVILVNGPNVLGAVFSGEVQGESTLNMLGAEAYARINLGCSSTHKLELIGGYSHFNIDDELWMSSTSVQTTGVGAGTITRFRDDFEMENRFDGGQIGFEMSAKRGRWTARSLTKVHLGNMNQHANIRGTTTRGPAGSLVSGVGGALPFDGYVDEERDVFAFIPEANFKLGYQFRNNVALSVGYSFLYFDNVAQVGDVINPLLDGPSLADPVQFGGQPFKFDDSSLWVQGIDLGVVITL